MVDTEKGPEQEKKPVCVYCRDKGYFWDGNALMFCNCDIGIKESEKAASAYRALRQRERDMRQWT